MSDLAPLTKVLKALADDTRLRIVALLAHGELCVCHLQQALDAPQPTVSRNLSVLRHAGVVTTRRDGPWVHYSLATPADAAAGRVVGELVAAFSDRADLAEEAERLRAELGPTCST